MMNAERQTRRHVVLPDLGVGDDPVALSLWLVKVGEPVAAGEPVAEVTTGPATVDLPSPVDGVLAEKLAAEGEPLAVGQRLAVVESET
jgi:pyruvate/2-oxoglutarate dehydrogenase complex dihydrolipoamide acyltransferase (E2) component